MNFPKQGTAGRIRSPRASTDMRLQFTRTEFLEIVDLPAGEGVGSFSQISRKPWQRTQYRQGSWFPSTRFVNCMLKAGGERLRLSPRMVGSVLTALGFLARQRINRGWKVQLCRDDDFRIHEMVRTFGLDHLSEAWIKEFPGDRGFEWVAPPECPLCKKYNLEY